MFSVRREINFATSFRWTSWSRYAFGRSCVRPTRHRFPRFLFVFKQMLRWLPSSQLLLRASPADLQIWIPCFEGPKLRFQTMHSVHHEIKIPWPLLWSENQQIRSWTPWIVSTTRAHENHFGLNWLPDFRLGISHQFLSLSLYFLPLHIFIACSLIKRTENVTSLQSTLFHNGLRQFCLTSIVSVMACIRMQNPRLISLAQ